MKKILFVVTELRLGGRERVVGNVADSLIDEFNVQIFSIWKKPPFFQTKTKVVYGENVTISKPNNLKKNAKLINKLRDTVVFPLVKKVASYSFLQRKRVTELINFIKINKIDTVVLTDLTMTFAKRISNEIKHVKIIGWVHMEPTSFFNKQYKNFKTELLTGMSKLDMLVTLTEKQKKLYEDICGIPTIYIPNPMPNSLSTSSLINKTITMVCRIDIEHKGLDLLIEVAKKIPDTWTIEMVGSGKVADEQKFAMLIKKNKLQNTIHWKPAIKGAELNAFYDKGSMFLMTSRFEGFPLTLGEAMAHGLPIVAFDIDGTNTILDNGKYGKLVPLNDIDKMVETIRTLTFDINKRKLLSKLSLERIKDFSPERIISYWNKIL